MEKILGTYISDKGCAVINSIGIPNKVGDGEFKILFMPERPEDCQPVGMIDFRNKVIVKVWKNDCDPEAGFTLLDKDAFEGAECVGIGVLSGDLIFWKMF